MIENWTWRYWSLYLAACVVVATAIAYPLIRLFEFLHMYRDNVRGIT